MIKLQAGEYLGSYRVQKFLGRGGFAYVYLAEDGQGRKVALKLGDVAGGGRYVTRFVEITDERSQEWISPDETPGEARTACGSISSTCTRSTRSCATKRRC
jgi:serine/threonine protein kinase